MNRIKISASLACANLLNIERDVRLLEKSGIDLIHIDIMDGIFVPNFCLNMDIMLALREATTIPMECHFMIEDPERYVERIANAGAKYLSVHYEATRHIQGTLTHIRQNGMKAGIALNPATPIVYNR